MSKIRYTLFNKKTGEKILSEDSLKHFALECIKTIDNFDKLESLSNHKFKTQRKYKFESEKFSLIGLFLPSDLSEIQRRNSRNSNGGRPTQRWFEHEFKLGEERVFLSTQWVNDEVNNTESGEINKNQLKYSDFRSMIDTCYGEYFYIEYEVLDGLTQTQSLSPESETTMKPLQKIYFGSPGTGKSHQCKEELKGYGIDEEKNEGVDRLFRTTFHPDSDYASFVGCYKPICVLEETAVQQNILDYDGLVDKLKEYIEVKPTNITRACTLFGYDYHDSIVRMQDNSKHTIPALVAAAYKPGSTYDSIVRSGMAVYENSNAHVAKNSSIEYRFAPQVFTEAYIQAWDVYENDDYEDNKMVCLVIEEINRGNCAQVFGDLFQLLDRKKDGRSEHRIKADTDLAKHLERKLKKRKDSEGIKGGYLCLPPNLSIFATMNTSDQSLFPMDSAFKRRWDWEYIPIDYSKAVRSGEFKIIIGEGDNRKVYNWVDFLEKVNPRILELTDSEDKLLGNFFIKGDIEEKDFKSKVMFYLWSEVCKDYVHSNSFFKYSKGNEKIEFTFNKLFGKDSTEILHGFMKMLEVEEIQNTQKTEVNN